MESPLVSEIIVFIASQKLGQFIIKKMDNVLESFEQPAKCSASGKSEGHYRKLPWPIFWAVVISIHIFRVVASTILVCLNKNPIKRKAVFRNIQKWRRILRGIRYIGLRKMNENTFKNGRSKGTNDGSMLQLKHSRRQRCTCNEPRNDSALAELMKRTFSVSTDEMDSTYAICGNEETSDTGNSDSSCRSIGSSGEDTMNVSWDVESFSPSTNTTDKSVPTTLAMFSASESMNTSCKTDANLSFESTVSDIDETRFMMTGTCSNNFVNDENETKRKGNVSTGSSDKDKSVPVFGKIKNEGEIPIDPADVEAAESMILKLAELRKSGHFTQFHHSNNNQCRSSKGVNLTGIKKRKIKGGGRNPEQSKREESFEKSN